MSVTDQTIDHLLSYVRLAVRAEQPYHVGGLDDMPVKLNQNESPYDLPESLKQELITSFLKVPFNRYPPEHPERLRHALAVHVGWEPAGILIGNGSNELTYLLGLSLIEKGTPVVMPRPMFSLYEKVARLHGGALTPVPPRPDLSFDAEAIREAVRRVKPALTVLTTPNNPTGLAMTLEEVQGIVEEAEGIVLVDEAYVEFNKEPSAKELLVRHPRVVLLRTFSKACGLAGLRIGYLMAHPRLIAEFAKARVPFMVDPLAEATALALLRHPELLADRARVIREQRQKLSLALSEIPGMQVVPSDANFVIFRAEMEPDLLMARLATAGVLVRSMRGYPELKGYLRVNAGTEVENQAFLAALKDALSAPEMRS